MYRTLLIEKVNFSRKSLIIFAFIFAFFGGFFVWRSFALGTSLTFGVYGDTYVSESDSSKNFQTNNELLADDGNPSREISYIQFSLTGLNGKIITDAKLRIKAANNPSWNAAIIYATYNTPPDYKVLTWNNRASLNGATKVGALGSVKANSWYDIPLSFGGWKDGTIHLIITGASSDGVSFYSNNSNNRPQLLLTTQATTINVPKPVVSLSTTPASPVVGDNLKLSWSSTNTPTVCIATGDWSGNKSSAGTENIVLSTPKTYQLGLSCSNSGGTGSKLISITPTLKPSTTPPSASIPSNWPIQISLTAPNTTGWELQSTGSLDKFNVTSTKIECYAGGWNNYTHYARVRKMIPEKLGYHVKGEFWMTADIELPSNFYEQNQSYMRLVGTDNYPKATDNSANGTGEKDEWRVSLTIYNGDKLPRLLSDHQGIGNGPLELWKGSSRLPTGRNKIAIHFVPSTGNGGSWEIYNNGVKLGSQSSVQTVPMSVPVSEQVISRFYGCIDGAANQDSKSMQVNLYGLELAAKEKAF